MTTTSRHLVGIPSEGSGGDSLEEFFSRLCAEYRRPLVRYVSRLLPNDPHRGEDVVQETLLRAWRHGHKLVRQQGRVLPWLFTVARNVVIDWHRRDQARPYEVDVENLDSLADNDNVAERTVDRQLLAEALSTLSRPHRETLFHLHYFDRTAQQAAAAMGVPTGTAKSRAHYGALALHEALLARGVCAA